ncbi:hypothetical protein HU200_048197 [Digitaria exilis]|uniref:Vacuolar protein sorting-associated protein 62 n=1 Tax=Digitaria exilis TaxID=1010633 RepID=A0A835AVS9_9POAL|nr:hypothetical protein HU200_048197 [Digitaria exilis]CAB3498403.1 unnamed protein product [Digitaria exilis]
MGHGWGGCFSSGDVRVGGPPLEEPDPEVFSFAEPLPPWPPGGGFARGRMCIGGGELELAAATSFQKICTLSPRRRQRRCGSSVTFYRPVGVPEGFSLLGHYCQPNCRPLHGHLLVARACTPPTIASPQPPPPPLCAPRDYTLVWEFRAGGLGGSGNRGNAGNCYGLKDAYFWVPVPPEGYKALGCLVTTEPQKPPLDEVACVRADLTDECEPYGSLLHLQLAQPSSSSDPCAAAFAVRGVRPVHRAMWGKGIGAGTFCCAADGSSPGDQGMACLSNVELDLSAMPTLEQAHAVIQHYGPTLFFHPKEKYLPSSVSWYFKNGAALYRRGGEGGEEVDGEGSNLPGGGCNDGECWIDVPSGERGRAVCRGNIDSAELYAHVKPAMGGACTDVAMWVLCPFNGPARLKLGPVSLPLGKTGRHVGDWEHFTLRVSNLTGELMGVYYSQHSGGHWVDASALEYTAGNKPVAYSSRNGHASYAYPGVYLQGSAALGIGIRNDAARSRLFVDSSAKYRIVAAEYLGEGAVAEPQWLQFMREWGPTTVYKSRKAMEWMVGRLPVRLRCGAEKMLNKMPNELSREEGPTGPKEKNNWEGDERW